MKKTVKLLIVSGLSGAGKTITLHSLEDMGAYCVDNLPVALLPAFAEQLYQLGDEYPCVAVGIDARTTALHNVSDILNRLQETQIPYEVLFLSADDSVLIKRFSETRRKHPLTSQHLPLLEAIQKEQELLHSLKSQSDIHINTSQLNVHQLRDLIRTRVGLHNKTGLSILFQSFGFKHGVPRDVNFVFDVRCLPNPYWQIELRSLTGRDKEVINYLKTESSVTNMLESLITLLNTWLPQFDAENRSYLTIAIGCTGGQHRSVYIAEQLAAHFQQQRSSVLVRHRELP